MKWAELSTTVSPELEDIVSVLIYEHTSRGVAMSTNSAGRTVIKGYLPVTDFFRVGAEEIKKKLKEVDPSIKVNLNFCEDKEWFQSWRSQFSIEKITEKFVICPEWMKDDYNHKDDEICVIINPGMAFGTGKHPTTELSLRKIEKYMKEDYKAVDLGTGSGILAAAFAKLGAEKVLAVDIDSAACEEAERNIMLNGVSDRIIIMESDLLQGFEDLNFEKFDILAVNILLNVIGKMLDDIVNILKPGGICIVSGITFEQTSDFYSFLKGLPLTVLEEQDKDGWVSIVLEKEC